MRFGQAFPRSVLPVRSKQLTRDTEQGSALRGKVPFNFNLGIRSRYTTPLARVAKGYLHASTLV